MGGYVLIYFLCGTLPWRGIKRNTRDEKVNLITNLKITTPIKRDDTKHRVTKHQIEVPNVFVEYMEYVKELGFKSRPNYEYLRNNFLEYFVHLNDANKKDFEWEE